MAEAAGEWFRDIVRAAFGSLDKASGVHGALQSIYLAGLQWSPSSLSFQDGGEWRVPCVTRDDMLAKRCPSRRTSSSAVKSPELFPARCLIFRKVGRV
jgi:hypothetical protein